MESLAIKLQGFNSLLRESEFKTEYLQGLHTGDLDETIAYTEVRERCEKIMLELASIIGELETKT